ncbi:Detected protein of unknown function [Hibiscus syriacus]|uniref:DUF7356 domain-containing protein n=1 Tax=Hibiscus syriacus TaxID=106335 RepID=A0A6A2ZUA6_HIBSY|nr:uncharacterized protein LOC120139484 isoform X1 [Hibiscus syriacus]KAE8694997.1 Detected protein of unknown function [Hibiscus syriacus]
MDRNAITTAILVFLVVADVSDAYPFWKFRFLADESSTKNDTTAAMPPSSQSPTKKLDPEPDGQSNLDPNPLNKTDSVIQPPVDKKDLKLSDQPGKVIPPSPQKGTDSGTNSNSTLNSTNVKPKEDNEEKKNNASSRNNSTSNSTNDKALKAKEEKKENTDTGKKPNSTGTEQADVLEEEKKNNASSRNNSTSNSTNDKALKAKEEKKENTDTGKKPNSTGTEQADVLEEDKNKKKPTEDGNETQSGIAETCDGVANSCKDSNSLTACIKGFEAGSKHRVVLVHNSGGKNLKVNVVGPSGESFVKGLKVPKHETQKVNISLTISETGELLVSAENGNCVLLMNPLASKGNPFLNLPSYDKLLTPVNGAYFLIATVLVFGGSLACCMFKKKSQHDSIPYQELEMGLPESMAATEVETAEGWDQGWDSDWDEDKAVKSPMGRRNVPNISANGLTTRSSNRDGWENDWDD